MPSRARGVASFYDDDYRPISTMTVRPDPAPARTRVVAAILEAFKGGRAPAALLSRALRDGVYSAAELRSELANASAPAFIDCQDLSGRSATALGARIAANCFYRTDGDRPRFWTFSFTPDGRVAYFELEE